MSDLISRSALIEKIYKIRIQVNVSKEVGHYRPFLDIANVLGCIEEQPTVEAIPKEKLQEILERLEEDSKHWWKMKQEALKYDKNDLVNRFDAFEIAINRTIDVIKEVGGMND